MTCVGFTCKIELAIVDEIERHGSDKYKKKEVNMWLQSNRSRSITIYQDNYLSSMQPLEWHAHLNRTRLTHELLLLLLQPQQQQKRKKKYQLFDANIINWIGHTLFFHSLSAACTQNLVSHCISNVRTKESRKRIIRFCSLSRHEWHISHSNPAHFTEIDGKKILSANGDINERQKKNYFLCVKHNNKCLLHPSVNCHRSRDAVRVHIEDCVR